MIHKNISSGKFADRPFATNLIVDHVHPAVFINRVVGQMHEDVGRVVASRFLVPARGEPESRAM